MGSEVLKCYPSGFLGSSVVTQTQPVTVFSRARSLISGDVLPHVINAQTSNRVIVDLWAEHLANTVPKRSWEHYELLLTTALRAFGTDSFKDWVITQSQSPEYSENHSAWIDETLSYIYLGKSRQFNYSTWVALLGPGGLSRPALPLSEPVITCLFGANSGKNTQPITKGLLLDVLRDWVSVPGGAEDLISSLNVLFGKR